MLKEKNQKRIGKVAEYWRKTAEHDYKIMTFLLKGNQELF